jgi:hypothetical protein
MTTESRVPSRRRKRLRTSVAIVGLFVVGIPLIYCLHWASNPWAMTLPGKPGLVGYWQGTVSYGPGDERRVVLRLIADPPSGRCSNCPDIDGAAEVCGASHRAVYDIYGDPLNYRGTRFSLQARRETEGPGLYLRQLNGHWDGRDLLTVSTSLVRIDPDGAARSTTWTDEATGKIMSDDVPNARFELRRAGEAEYDGAC